MVLWFMTESEGEGTWAIVHGKHGSCEELENNIIQVIRTIGNSYIDFVAKEEASS
jgi:hypothetical protein